MSNQTKELQKAKITDLNDLFQKARGSLEVVLPKHLTPERIIKIALSAVSRNHSLMQCSTVSILQAVMLSSQLGLEAGGPFGSAYLVPFKNKYTGTMEAQLIPGYRGLMELARRSGKIHSIEARIVYIKDKFQFQYGSNPLIFHEPYIEKDPGEMIYVYAIAWPVEGNSQFDVMTKEQVDKIRNRSMAKDSGPWVTDYLEMARKTVVRRLCKYLPLTPQLSTALEIDERIEKNYGTPDLIDIPGFEVEEAPQTSDVKSPAKLSSKNKSPQGSQGSNIPESGTPPAFEPITTDQKKQITDAMKKAGKDEAQTKQYLSGAFGIKDMDNIPSNLFNEVFGWVKDLDTTEAKEGLFK